MNALFKDYKLQDTISYKYPIWIITDVRFKNEANEIKKRGGILIRLNRGKCDCDHPSETDLDEYPHFDIHIDNKDIMKLSDLYDIVRRICKSSIIHQLI